MWNKNTYCNFSHILKTWLPTHLSEAVKEVILVVPGDGVVEVVESAEVGALASAREVSLERPSAGVLYTDVVSIVRPYALEQRLKLCLLIYTLPGPQHRQSL